MKLPFWGRRYYLKFGLERDPFPQNPTDQKVFLTHDMIHCLDEIKASVDSSEELIAVASPSGSGKTVLSRYLGFIKSANWFVAHISGSRELDRETLAYEVIRQHFPERKFAREQAVYLLKEFLQLFARNGRTPVVVIDDAHTLSLETLKFVLEIATLNQQQARYRIVFFGDLTLDEKLSDPNLRALKPERYHHFRIPSLSLAQTRKYLEYRLSLCGEISEDPFDEESVQTIFRESAGLPGEVHAPARQVMQEFHVAGGQQQLYVRSAATAAACLLVFSGVYSAMNEDYIEKSEQVSISRQTPVEVIPVRLPGTGTLIKPAASTDPAETHKEEVKEEVATTKTQPSQGLIEPEPGLARRMFGWLFDGAESADTDPQGRSRVIASLDSQLSLKLSDVIAN